MYSRQQYSINSFGEIRSHDFFQELTDSIRNELKQESKERILKVDEQKYKDYLINKYTLTPLEIYREDKIVNEPSKSEEHIKDAIRGRSKIEVYNFTVKYPFTGSPSLFKMAPNNRTVSSEPVIVDESENTVAIEFRLQKKDAEAFKNAESKKYNKAFINVEKANSDAEDWNKRLDNLVNKFFESVKEKHLEENKFYEAINVQIDEETETVFSAPEIEKKVVPKPDVSKGKYQTSEPTMSEEIYQDIIKVLNETGKKMERKPSLYRGKDEEDLRDLFLFLLETRYKSTTASGETFNKDGKTDIILKYSEDGTNLFVAECKFWSGIKGFFEAIDQLFDRYLTWRDSKVSILLFVENKNFTKVLDEIKDKITDHKYYVNDNGQNGESSFSYIFSLPDDPDKEVYLEVMAFHFPK